MSDQFVVAIGASAAEVRDVLLRCGWGLEGEFESDDFELADFQRQCHCIVRPSFDLDGSTRDRGAEAWVSGSGIDESVRLAREVAQLLSHETGREIRHENDVGELWDPVIPARESAGPHN